MEKRSADENLEVTTPVSPVSVQFDDATLLQLVVSPRKKLFPTLNRASAFTPLIVVCCAVPGLLMLANPMATEVASLWGLRSLAVANSSTGAAVLEPGLGEPGELLLFQPPLVAWLNGMIIRVIGPSNPLSMSLVSLLATGITIWITSRCAWRIGGANTALIAALLMCSHPFVFESATTPTNGPAGFCLMLCSVFGLQRHLESNRMHFSASLILSGLTWGLALLAIGPVALTIPLIFAVHAYCPLRRQQSQGIEIPIECKYAESPFGRKSIPIFFGIGLLVGGWWELLMCLQYGLPFLGSWWSSLAVECLPRRNVEWRCDLAAHICPCWREWLTQYGMLLGWIIVGLERSWHEWCQPENERSRQRFQLLMLWWGITFLGRCLVEIAGVWTQTNTAVWNVALFVPTILLASLGIGSLIERAVSRRGEFFLIVLMVSLTVWRVTMSWTIALVAAAIVATLMVCGPTLMPNIGRTERGWTEAGWRQLLQFTVYGSLVACLSAGLGMRQPASPDENRIVALKHRLYGLPDVRRISLISSRDPIPVTLRYILRCRWPQAEIVSTDGWDTGLTAEMHAEASAPRSHFLVLEWTRRDIRLDSEAGKSWQITAVGDPMRFQGRRLSLVLIGPKT